MTELKPGTPVTVVHPRHKCQARILRNGQTAVVEAPQMGRTPPNWVCIRYDTDRTPDQLPASYVQPVAK